MENMMILLVFIAITHLKKQNVIFILLERLCWGIKIVKKKNKKTQKGNICVEVRK